MSVSLPAECRFWCTAVVALAYGAALLLLLCSALLPISTLAHFRSSIRCALLLLPRALSMIRNLAICTVTVKGKGEIREWRKDNWRTNKWLWARARIPTFLGSDRFALLFGKARLVIRCAAGDKDSQ